MHLNFYFLKRLSCKLAQILPGYEIVEVFSQNKDELIISMLKGRKEFHIKALLSTQFACLTFPEEFARARKNSIDLFQEIIGLQVIGVHQFQNERSFSIKLENEFQLLFKMHGKRANVILYKDETQLTLFNSQMKFDLGLSLSALERELTQDENSYDKEGLAIYPTFDKTVKNHLYASGYNDDNPENWRIISDALDRMEKQISIFQSAPDKSPELTLLNPPPNSLVLNATNDPIEAANNFFFQYSKKFYLWLEKESAIRVLTKQLKKTKNYLIKTISKLDELENNSRNKELADILMANVHAIPGNTNEVTLYDFYKDQQLTIKLKKDLSPQKNAEYYYRKSKNQKVETDKLKENIRLKRADEEKFLKQVDQIGEIEQVKTLRKYLKDQAIVGSNTATVKEAKFKEFEISGWKILVGRNAKNNDELTLKEATKNDLWLHAKDVSGSHVVIKQQSGKNFPATVIEVAAQIAAYYSKRKNDSVCPVINTPKKYVRKPKGFPPGQVVVDQEKVILVEPNERKDLAI